ncbi:hypothetical protein M885DRAFT_565643 [Pelagophyceae sp. CCMP2097]|nr:hypothetical protein M885DRAFT_565643 [Pelagophyceae sp. CCMP2097]
MARCLVAPCVLEVAKAALVAGRHTEAAAILLRARGAAEDAAAKGGDAKGGAAKGGVRGGDLQDADGALDASLRALARNPRRALGVAPAASLHDVRRAYRAAALLYHPDKNNGTTGELFAALTAAYHDLVAADEAGGRRAAAAPTAHEAAAGRRAAGARTASDAPPAGADAHARHQGAHAHETRPARPPTPPRPREPPLSKPGGGPPMPRQKSAGQLRGVPDPANDDAFWESMFWRMAAFRLKEGHCFAPAAAAAAAPSQRARPSLGEWATEQLGGWAVEQRIAHECGQLASPRRNRLESIGFEIHEADWRRRVAETTNRPPAGLKRGSSGPMLNVAASPGAATARGLGEPPDQPTRTASQPRPFCGGCTGAGKAAARPSDAAFSSASVEFNVFGYTLFRYTNHCRL